MEMPETVDLNLELQGLRIQDVGKIIRLVTLMKYLGSIGSSRTIKLFVDGDGAFGFYKLLVDGRELTKDETLTVIGDYDSQGGLDIDLD